MKKIMLTLYLFLAFDSETILECVADKISHL